MRIRAFGEAPFPNEIWSDPSITATPGNPGAAVCLGLLTMGPLRMLLCPPGYCEPPRGPGPCPNLLCHHSALQSACSLQLLKTLYLTEFLSKSVQTSLGSQDEMYKVCFHFRGKNKPWNKCSVNISSSFISQRRWKLKNVFREDCSIFLVNPPEQPHRVRMKSPYSPNVPWTQEPGFGWGK